MNHAYVSSPASSFMTCLGQRKGHERACNLTHCHRQALRRRLHPFIRSLLAPTLETAHNSLVTYGPMPPASTGI